MAPTGGKVNLGRLQGAASKLPPESVLRLLLLSERRLLSAREFSAKSELWAKLALMEEEAADVAAQLRRAIEPVREELRRLRTVVLGGVSG